MKSVGVMKISKIYKFKMLKVISKIIQYSLEFVDSTFLFRNENTGLEK